MKSTIMLTQELKHSLCLQEVISVSQEKIQSMINTYRRKPQNTSLTMIYLKSPISSGRAMKISMIDLREYG
jgi:hypothetical protein